MNMANQESPRLTEFKLSCPIPRADYPQILLAHGGGGKLTHSLIEKMFAPTFDNSFLDELHDGAVFDSPGNRLAVSTDSYVVQPLFFPGGNIGELAVYGTVNDLAMCGARPLYLSVGMILEEGLEMETLWRVVSAMRKAADETGVKIVTGDTKVVDNGKGDGVFINTTGIGIVLGERAISPERIEPGDVVLLSGDIGRHGIAIMATREGLEFETTIESDSAPLADMVLELVDEGLDVKCMRDLTRGGLGTCLIEIAESAGTQIEIEEAKVPVCDHVRGACEILGLDPLYVANEGRCVVILSAKDADRGLRLMKGHTVGVGACEVGRVIDNPRGIATMLTIGGSIVLDMPSGEQLPRIC